MKKVLLVLLAVTLFNCSKDECIEEYSVREVVSNNRVASDKVTVCHDGNTLEVNQNALQGHLEHGDTLGACDTLSDPVFVRPNVVAADCGYDYGDVFEIDGKRYRVVY